jgi:oligopeptide transport system ATP-binding protein
VSAVEPLLSVTGLSKRFADKHTIIDKARRRPPGVLTALDNVDIFVRPGETLGVVGETGSGKSTLARCIVRLYEPDSGSVTFDGADVLAAGPGELRALRRAIQMIYQDPYSSLNPRLRVGAAIAEPARVHGMIERGEEERYAAELLERVGMRRETARQYPHEFSGGQRQRIAIARSLALNPRLLIADEAVSALDVSIQAQLLSLLEEIRRDLGLTIIFIAHQLSVISRLADRVAIMYLGRVVETGATADVFANPRHPYTQMLLEAHPRLDGTRVPKPRVTREMPSPYAIPEGCRFRTRCPLAEDICVRVDPPAVEVESDRGGHTSACHVLAPSGQSSSSAPGSEEALVGDAGPAEQP